jgi:hypothetical protein
MLLLLRCCCLCGALMHLLLQRYYLKLTVSTQV